MKATSIVVPVTDLDAACAFYRDALNLTLKFRDGNRYCAFDLGGFGLALVAGEERIIDEPALTVKVEKLGAAVASLQIRGAAIVQPAERGPHEHRAVLRAPGGALCVLSAPEA